MNWSRGSWHRVVSYPNFTTVHNTASPIFTTYSWFWHLEWVAASDRQRSIPSSRHQSRGSSADATGLHVYQGRRETSCLEISLITSALRQLSCPIHLLRTKHLVKQDWSSDRPTNLPTDEGALMSTGILVPARAEHQHVCEHEFFKTRLFRRWITRKTDFSNVIFFFRNMSCIGTYYIFFLKYVLRVKSFRMTILQNVKL